MLVSEVKIMKVNVIGQIAPGYLPLAHCVKNGSAFTLTPWS